MNKIHQVCDKVTSIMFIRIIILNFIYNPLLVHMSELRTSPLFSYIFRHCLVFKVMNTSPVRTIRTEQSFWHITCCVFLHRSADLYYFIQMINVSIALIVHMFLVLGCTFTTWHFHWFHTISIMMPIKCEPT
jgi:hypothetical protein